MGVYDDEFAKAEANLHEIEKYFHLCKWARRTGDEPDVVDRGSWKEKIQWAKSELAKKGVK